MRSDNDTDWTAAVGDVDVGASGGDVEVVDDEVASFELPAALPEDAGEC